MNARKINVLVADDNEQLHRVFAFTLSEAGYNVSFASSGEAAYEALKQRTFDVAIVDIKMGDSINGVIIAARGIADYPKTKIILVTGLLGLAKRKSGSSTLPGSHAMLFKPVEPDHLLEVIDQVLTP